MTKRSQRGLQGLQGTNGLRSFLEVAASSGDSGNFYTTAERQSTNSIMRYVVNNNKNHKISQAIFFEFCPTPTNGFAGFLNLKKKA